MNSSGTRIATYDYDAWGNITAKTGAMADINPFRYRGYYQDDETGFYYLNTRYYDPEIRRFINADNYELLPQLALISGQLNLYTYCNNNPVMFTDSTGQFVLTAFLICLGVGVVAGGVLGGYTAYANGAALWSGEFWAGVGTGALIGGAVGAIAGLGGAYLASGLLGVGGKFTEDLFAYTMFGTSFGTWEDYAIAFIASGAMAGRAPWLKALVDIGGRPLATQLAKMGTGRQSEFQLDKFGYDIITRAATFGIPSPWKPFARGITKGYWDLWKRGFFGSSSQGQFYYV